MKKLVVFLCLILAVGAVGFGCASRLPSVCDDVTGPCLLCQTADKYNVRLEDIGNGLILVNMVAVNQGLYSVDDAKGVMESLLSALDGSSLTYALFKDKIIEYTKDYPGLLSVTSAYMDEFALSQYIYEADREILREWLKGWIQSLGASS